MDDILKFAFKIGYDAVGIQVSDYSQFQYIDFIKKNHDKIFLRLKQKPTEKIYNNYILVTEDIDEIVKSPSKFDVFVLKDFHNYRMYIEKIKRLNRKIGLEIQFSDLRGLNSFEIAKFFKYLKIIFKFCVLSSNTFIISSGSKSIAEMISPRIIDALLKFCSISPEKYWYAFNSWFILKNRVYSYA
ncbi:MAG: hypothetical protein DA328_09485 [Nitrososphaeraceae archaeon]|nr:hypothetical protein [Nitrososphaeraceae archaeon]